MVPVAEISDPKNDYNLNLPRYIDSTEPEDLQDIDGHLRGGIPDRDIDGLDRYWQVIPGVRVALFKNGDRPGYCQFRLPIAEVKPAIFGHAEFTAFNELRDQALRQVEKSQHSAAQRISTRTAIPRRSSRPSPRICSPTSGKRRCSMPTTCINT